MYASALALGDHENVWATNFGVTSFSQDKDQKDERRPDFQHDKDNSRFKALVRCGRSSRYVFPVVEYRGVGGP